MSTHMFAWSIAKIITEKEINIWFVTSNKCENNNIVKKLISILKKFEDLRVNSRIIKNTTNKSKLHFVTLGQSINEIFIGRDVPDYVIYDNMAFMNSSKLNEFITMLDLYRGGRGKSTKEICVSTPSKGGSIFNFLALIAENPIKIPWYERWLSKTWDENLSKKEYEKRRIIKSC